MTEGDSHSMSDHREDLHIEEESTLPGTLVALD